MHSPLEALADTRILITGANRGIGLAFVEAALEAGAVEVIACARDPRTVTEHWGSREPRVTAIELDVTCEEHVNNVAEFVGAVDLVISNAGRTGGGLVLTMDEEDARDLFEVHLWGPWRLASALSPAMARGGGFIFVQSIAALILSRRGPFYSASKGAATLMAVALREALGEAGITVTNVFPGFTDTGMVTDDPVRKATPRAVANAALAGWCARESSVFPDEFAQRIHERISADYDASLDRPWETVSDVYRSITTTSE